MIAGCTAQNSYGESVSEIEDLVLHGDMCWKVHKPVLWACSLGQLHDLCQIFESHRLSLLPLDALGNMFILDCLEHLLDDWWTCRAAVPSLHALVIDVWASIFFAIPGSHEW